MLHFILVLVECELLSEILYISLAQDKYYTLQ